MNRFKNKRTAVVIVVNDEMAAKLGNEWEAVEDKTVSKPAPRKSRAKK